MGKVLLILFIIAIFIGGFYIFNIITYEEPKTSVKIDSPEILKAKIELGIIPVIPIQAHNSNDVYTELNMQTDYGTCRIYRDIFGKHYCRW